MPTEKIYGIIKNNSKLHDAGNKKVNTFKAILPDF